MGTHHELTQGDTGEQIVLELTATTDGAPIVFAGATVVTEVWQGNSTPVPMTASAVVDGFTLENATVPCGVLTVTMSDAWQAAAVGSYKMVHRVALTSGPHLTFPSGPPDTLHVDVVGA